MQGHGSHRKQELEEDDHAPVTPRGMAAPPPHAPRRIDSDAGRPATIRIEANTRPLLLAQHAAAATTRPAARVPLVPTAAGEKPTERLHGLALSQGLLLNAFVLLMVFGWSSPLPGRRWLLAAFAVGGIVVAVLIHFALRARHGAATRRRPARGASSNSGDRLRVLAVRGLPAALVTGWIALGLYALALPPTANAFQDDRAAATAAPTTTAPATRTIAPSAVKPVDATPSKEVAPGQPAKHGPLRI